MGHGFIIGYGTGIINTHPIPVPLTSLSIIDAGLFNPFGPITHTHTHTHTHIYIYIYIYENSNENSNLIANIRTAESASRGIFSLNNTRLLFRPNIMHYSR